MDRLKDIIKYSDYTFAPSELEEILLSHDQVKEAAVVSVPRGDVGDVTTAFVVLKSCSPVKTPVTPDELVRLVAGECSRLYPVRIMLKTKSRPGIVKVIQ